jgi:hypothetical protein
MTAQSQPASERGINVLRQLRAAGVLGEITSENRVSRISTSTDEHSSRSGVTNPDLRQALFSFTLGHCTEVHALWVDRNSPPLEIARAAVKAAQASMLKRGFTKADLPYLKANEGRWVT